MLVSQSFNDLCPCHGKVFVCRRKSIKAIWLHCLLQVGRVTQASILCSIVTTSNYRMCTPYTKTDRYRLRHLYKQLPTWNKCPFNLISTKMKLFVQTYFWYSSLLFFGSCFPRLGWFCIFIYWFCIFIYNNNNIKTYKAHIHRSAHCTYTNNNTYMYNNQNGNVGYKLKEIQNTKYVVKKYKIKCKKKTQVKTKHLLKYLIEKTNL